MKRVRGMDFWMWMRSCARCSAYWPPIDLLCERCWREMVERASPRRRSLFENDFEVFSLWDWHGDTDDIGELIKRRKSVHFDKAHERMAGFFLRNTALLSARTIVFPSKNPQIRDHTASLADAFSEQLGIPAVAVPILFDAHYKQRGQRERLQNRRALRSLRREVQGPYLFVDDVLTTGATALAVWKALGKPRDFSAAVLVYRAKRNN